MTASNWSLAKRLQLWFTLACLLPSLAAILLGGWFLGTSVSREIVALLHEELDEAETLLTKAADIGEEFAGVSVVLAGRHPEYRMAWRLRDSRIQKVIGEYGNRELLAKVADIPADQAAAHAVGDGLFGATRTLALGFELSLVIDGRVRSGLLNRYWLTACLMALLGGAVAFGLARLLATRVSRLLARVASDLDESGESSSSASALTSAPEEIRAVADSLRRNLDRIRGESEESRLFMATLAHELRSPIQNLIGRAEVTLMRPRGDSVYEAALQEQLEELSEFGDAVDNFLALCASESPGESSAVETFDLAVEMELRLQRERQRAERNGVRLTMSCEGDATLRGDREVVLRAVRNVVANAVDWSESGSVVLVQVEGGPDQVTVTVDDSGPGVPEAMREDVFRPFMQRVAPESRRSGFGLGLAIAKKAVEAQGGRIELTSSPSGGARFRMIFRGPRGEATEVE